MNANYTYLTEGTKAAAYTSASAGKDYVGSFVYSRGSGGTRTLESVPSGSLTVTSGRGSSPQARSWNFSYIGQMPV